MLENPVEMNPVELKALEEALLEVRDVQRVIRVEVFEIKGHGKIVGTKVSLDACLTMQQVSIVVALAERRVAQVIPEAKHVYIVPDIWMDPNCVPSTSSIVTLSYD